MRIECWICQDRLGGKHGETEVFCYFGMAGRPVKAVGGPGEEESTSEAKTRKGKGKKAKGGSSSGVAGGGGARKGHRLQLSGDMIQEVE